MTEALQPFRVLVVCAGNTCRSPMAAQLLRARLGDVPGFVVESAGILAEVGSPMTADARTAVIARVGSAVPHRARQLTEQMVLSADLVLTATRAIRADTVRSVPGAVRRTFTMKEFARLAQRMPRDATPTLERLAASVAAERAAEPEADDDVADPIGRPASEYERVAAVLDDAAQVIAAALADSARQRPTSPDVVVEAEFSDRRGSLEA
ncbi:low molecular weight phosphatase family protein [Humibacter sp. RRB41]|uniref:arsenate reductase/protein-tyrosine-phosphatase family protein n=1 Tax=Humibacter sp. RRB41 TaxID=2919946 RepID=UPI001FAA0543|nr:low molecular weight phosphatase family protein [Humibacter sp. RRB41]